MLLEAVASLALPPSVIVIYAAILASVALAKLDTSFPVILPAHFVDLSFLTAVFVLPMLRAQRVN